MVEMRMTNKVVPAYVSWRTMRNELDRMRKDGIPGEVDAGFLKQMSGATQSQFRGAMRYLGLIDEDNQPLPILERLVFAEGPERQEVLREVLRNSYPFLLGPDARPFDLATATDRQLKEKFQAIGASGDTVRKCELFFLNAAIEASLPISKYIMQSRQRSESQSRSKPDAARKKASTPSQNGSNQQLPVIPAVDAPQKVAPSPTIQAQGPVEGEDPEVWAMRQVMPAYPSQGDIEEKRMWYEEMREFRQWVMTYTIAKIRAQRCEEQELES